MKKVTYNDLIWNVVRVLGGPRAKEAAKATTSFYWQGTVIWRAIVWEGEPGIEILTNAAPEHGQELHDIVFGFVDGWLVANGEKAGEESQYS